MPQPPLSDNPGVLTPPGIIGRMTRLILGALCVYVVFAISAQAADFFTGRALDEPSVWFLILLGLYTFPDVITIGFGKAWNHFRLRADLVALATVAGLISLAAFGSVFGPPLGILVSTWLLYTFGHMGISFLLATLLATPGCEMRSIPQAWERVSGRKTKLEYCPGVLTPIDRWESKLGASPPAR